MTKDEAIKGLKYLAKAFDGYKPNEEMFRMAIEALEHNVHDFQKDADCISRQAAINVLSLGKEILSRVLDDMDVVGTDRDKYSWGIRLIEANINDIEELPSVQPVAKDINVSCKDAISRQDAIDHFKSIADATSIGNKYNEGFVDGLNFAVGHLETMPSVQPERKKDTIQKFHDYQVEWLLSHCDLELEPQLEEWVVRFLHDTANCYMMEIDREEGGQK